jgi:chemotaxis protein MotB
MNDNAPDCPPCEEGAPKWVVTFGDLMSLLLCFFVLLLSFSEMDRAKYKQVAGSLEKAFGVQRKSRTMERPKGLKMIAKDFDQAIVPPLEKDEFLKMQKQKDALNQLAEAIENQFRDLKDLIQIDIGNEGVTIRLMGETAFDSGKDEIRSQMIPVLAKIITVLEESDGEIIVAGHTDDRPIRGGRFRSNLDLSVARAVSVASYLIANSRIDPAVIATMGFGEYRPLDTNASKAGRQKNRRVEIIVRSPDPEAAETEAIEPEFVVGE